MSIAAMSAAVDKMSSQDFDLGYDQGQRWSFFDRSRRTLTRHREGDCSSTCGAAAVLGGYPVNLADPFYTGTFASRLKEAGFRLIGVSGWSKDRLYSTLREGDFVVGPGHVVYVRRPGAVPKVWSTEADENGGRTGGAAGDQTGKESRIRDMYMRDKGWQYIVRPPSESPPPTTVTVFGPVVVQANLQDVRFGGSLDYVGRADVLHEQGGKVLLLSESTSKMRDAVRAHPGRWKTYVEPTGGSVAVLWDATVATYGTPRYVSFGDNYHGAVGVPLTIAGTTVVYVATHGWPAKTASLSKRLSQAAKAFALAGSGAAVVGGDWNCDADTVAGRYGFRRVTPDVDTVDAAGDQRYDAIYVRGLDASSGKVIDPGVLSDHKWTRVKLGEAKASNIVAPTPTPTAKLAVDGVLGRATTNALQVYLGMSPTGVLDRDTIRRLQIKLGVVADSVVGPVTVRALQKYVGASVDGIWGPATTRALQRYLNTH